MNKKILSVKPTKNPCKFIFETEMSADALAHLMQAEFPNTYECIDSIKPSGLWKDKLFVTVDEKSFNSCDLNTLAIALNKKLEAEDVADWIVEYMGSINTTMHVKESTARYFMRACNQDQFAYYDGVRIETKNIKLIKNAVTGEQLWPRENAKFWYIMFKSAKTNRVTTLLNTKQYAENVIENLIAHGCGTINLFDVGVTVNDTAYVDSIKVFNEKNEQIWPRENMRLWHVKTNECTYDVNTEVANAYMSCLKSFEMYGVGYAGANWHIIETIDHSNLKGVSYDSVISITDPNGVIIYKKKTYCEVVVAHRSRSLFVTHEDANEIIGWINEAKESDFKLMPHPSYITIHDQKGDVRTSVLLYDIKHIYDENGNDMLADGLEKIEKKTDVWHVSIDCPFCKGYDVVPATGERIRAELIELGDKTEYSSMHEIYFKDASSVEHRVFAYKITCIKTANNRVIWSKKQQKTSKPEATTFKAPSLLSRIYE